MYYGKQYVILFQPRSRQQKPKIGGLESISETDPVDSTNIPQRLPDIQRPSNTSAGGHLHQQVPFGPQNFPQPQVAHYPPYPQPGVFQHGMYPSQYPTTGPGSLHATYGGFPFQPLLQPSFPYPPSSYAYGHSSHLHPQQSADPRFYMGATASYEQATGSPARASFPERSWHPRGVHQYYTPRPPVQANVRVGINQIL
jgi:hypothetical protein